MNRRKTERRHIRKQLTRVLMVEDDRDTALLTLRLLSLAPPEPPTESEIERDAESCCIYGAFCPLHVSTLNVAAAVLRQNREYFDAVLLDMILPDGEREDAVRLIREAHPDIAIVVHSNLTEADLVTELLRAGDVQGYILKGTVDGKALRRDICHAIEKKLLARELESITCGCPTIKTAKMVGTV